jgi:membrane-associated phospholipid phosphatase
MKTPGSLRRAAALLALVTVHATGLAARYVAPVMYGGATLVGLSRMYHNKHWTSDIVLGAGIGTFSGIKVVRYSHAHPDNFIDRMLLKTSVAPDGHGGGVVAFTVPVPQ